MTNYELAIYGGAGLTVTAQLLLKLGATRGRGRGAIRRLLSPLVLAGYGLLLAVTAINFYGLQQVPLITMGYVNAAVQLLVALMAYLLMGERLTRRQWWAQACIAGGILLLFL